MRILVLGGSVFLSKRVVLTAVARGHEVTAVARGTTGPPFGRYSFVKADRTEPLPDLGDFDAVVDVARHPSWVREAVVRHADAHWVFVSTVNVYADDATPGGTPATLPLVEPIEEDVDLADRPDAYGPMKVACERIVQTGTASSTVIRPGLIVGTEDPTGRFSYWPHRLGLRPYDAMSEVLAPGDPADVMQVIDVRDLASWVVTCCEQRTEGVFDGVGPAMPMADLLAACAQEIPGKVSWTWVDQEFLQAQGVEPWMGPDAIPLWLPRPAYDGLGAHDVQPSLDAGLTITPLSRTSLHLLGFLDATPEAVISGISLERERELLAAWHAR